MKNQKIFLASTGSSLARAEYDNKQWVVTFSLEGIKINALVSDPSNPQIIYLATQNDGVYRSNDGGKSWKSMGLSSVPVKALAIDPSDPQTIYAGCKPVSLYISKDGGESWRELDAIKKSRKWWWFSPADLPGMTPYINDLAVSPDNPDVILAGVELGAVLRSEDRGQSWSKHLKGCDRDCHSLKFHSTDGNWAYEGGGLSGVAFSKNGGRDWDKPKVGLGKKYGWAVVADPAQPEIWYLSAAEQGNPLRGEFTPPGHNDGQANAHIYRKDGDAPWTQLSGGLPEPLDYMAYALAIVPDEPGHLYAGLGNGQIWHSEDYGDRWQQMPFDLVRVQNGLLVI